MYYSTQENTFIEGQGFWISYNPHTDTGLAETALCQGEENTAYRILNGNHLEAYRPLVASGFQACLQKYDELVKSGVERSKWSDDVTGKIPDLAAV
jgi:hypothetical protein